MSTADDDWETVPIERLNISQNHSSNGNSKPALGPPQPTFNINSGMNINFMQGVPSQAAIAAVIAAQNDPPLDPTLFDAINSKERMIALKYEDQLLRFVKSGQISFEIPPISNTYQKLLIYRIAQRFRLEHVPSDKVLGGERGIRIIRTVDTTIPRVLLINLGTETPLEKQSPPISNGSAKIKFLKRDTGAGSGPTKSDNSTAKLVPTEAEREKIYADAKARIFGEPMKSNSNPNLEDTSNITTVVGAADAEPTNPSSMINPPTTAPTAHTEPPVSDTTSKQSITTTSVPTTATTTAPPTSNKSTSDQHRTSSSSSTSSSSNLNAPLRPNASFLPKGKKLAEREGGAAAVAKSTKITTGVPLTTTTTTSSLTTINTTTSPVVPAPGAGVGAVVPGKPAGAGSGSGREKEEDSTLLAQRLKEREKSKKVAVVDAGQWKGKRSTTRNKIAELSDPDFARNPSPSVNYQPAPLLPPTTTHSPYSLPSPPAMYGPPGPPPMNQFQQQQQQQQLPSNYNMMNPNNNNPFFMMDPRNNTPPNVPPNIMNAPFHQLPYNNNNNSMLMNTPWQHSAPQYPPLHQQQLPPPPDRSNNGNGYGSDMPTRTAPLLPSHYYPPSNNSSGGGGGGYPMPVNIGGGGGARYDNYYQAPMAPSLPPPQSGHSNLNHPYMNTSSSTNNSINNPSMIAHPHPYANQPQLLPAASAPLLPTNTSVPIQYNNYNVDFPPLG